MVYLKTLLLLFCSNVFMTFAWYAHLKHGQDRALWLTIIVSWLIAFVEYIFLIPANRIGFYSGQFSLEQLKVLQEVMTLGVFVPFALFYMKQPLSWNFVGAGCCLIGAVYFIFR